MQKKKKSEDDLLNKVSGRVALSEFVYIHGKRINEKF